MSKDRGETKGEVIKILEQSLECMKESYPDEIKRQLQVDLFSEEFDKFITVLGQDNKQVMGYFDVNINKFVSINMLSLVLILAERMNQIFLQNNGCPALSAGISLGIFVASLLNIIQPSNTVKLEREDAEVYCAFLKLQRDRPINSVITFEEIERCVKKMEGEIDLSKCLTHLEENRLIKKHPNGFLVKREVRVETVS